MNSSQKLPLLVLLICSSLGASLHRADARGGGYYYPPEKEVRQPGVWYGDSYMSEADKKAIYKNYTGTSNNVSNNVSTAAGTTTAGTNGNPNQITPVPNYAPTPQTFSGPAHIEPESYHYFVQEYHWQR